MLYNQCTERDSKGNELTEDRPSGADAEDWQGAKTINADPQQRKRDEKWRRKTSAAYQKAEVERNIVNDIFQKNCAVGLELKVKTASNSVSDAIVSSFVDLKPPAKLQDFIHARNFDSQTF